MKNLSAVAIGLDALRVNPLRTVLSTLGVIIGVASLVAVLSLGDGMERAVRSQISETTDLQSVSIRALTLENVDGQRLPIRDPLVFSDVDARTLRAMPDVDGVLLLLQGRAELRTADGRSRRMGNVMAAITLRDSAPVPRVASGRLLTPDEGAGNSRDIVIAYDLASYFASSAAAAVGQTLLLGDSLVRVIGVLEKSSQPPTPASPGDYRVLTSYGLAQRVLPPVRRSPPQLVVHTARVEETEAVRQRVEHWLAVRDSAWRLRAEVMTMRGRVDQAATGILMFKLFMGAITGISLLVGGIGIMNVLLASVTERTREIGIRKAAGARARDILVQFLAESVAISGVGSLIGAALGLTGAFVITAIIRRFAQAPFLLASFSWSTLVVAAMAALLVGVLFGTYPARRAARLSPIDAMRHE
jgi:putative ABC transport system permease protein